MTRHLAACFALATFLAFVGTGTRAFGYNNKGHRIVASIAYHQMSPQSRQRLVEILKQHPRSRRDFDYRMPSVVEHGSQEDKDRWMFTQAAVWPDIARGFQGADKTRFHRPYWHFINIPVFLSEEHRQALAGRINVNLSQDYPSPTEEGQLNIAQAFKMNLAVLKSSETSDPEKAVAVCWLFHLGGDSHQPFHAAALFTPLRFDGGDKGGNNIPLRQRGNLHALWDGFLGSNDSPREVVNEAKLLLSDETLKEYGETAANSTDVSQWLNESNKIADEFGYDRLIRLEVQSKEDDPELSLDEISLPQEYLEEGGRISNRRVVEAGYRLAAVLESSLSP